MLESTKRNSRLMVSDLLGRSNKVEALVKRGDCMGFNSMKRKRGRAKRYEFISSTSAFIFVALWSMKNASESLIG
ncbi:unnamed protein product [Sphenostylis stenocarpa]|uniref:Uncharacterized protein n=1 Tax=Sphenostylis stenocarpa TaxID=92480 RepID=A0AA86SAB5_9FABA|nr:unnamed protein product [Sphenostylis stenocarpa]